MPEHKVHYHWISRQHSLPLFCRPSPTLPKTYYPQQMPQHTEDRAQVTCKDCLKRMARLLREGAGNA